MTRPFLIVLNAAAGGAQAAQNALDSVSEVTYWYRCFPDAIFVTARLTANELSERLSSRLGINGMGDKRIVVTQINPSEVQGWLPKAAWHLVNNPTAPILPPQE